MPAFQRVHGTYDNYSTGTLRATGQHKAFLITVKDNSAAVDLQARDGDATDGTETDQLVELVVKEIAPLMYYAPSNNSGQIHVIMDGHHVTADSILARIKPIIAGELGGANTVANNTSTVAEGTAITVA